MRDKLIELIKSRRDPCDIGACPFTVDDVRPCSLCEAESLAEHLIANGVTFAEDNNVPCKLRTETCSIANPFKELSKGLASLTEKLKHQTNGDRIRAMSDEELAYWFEWRSLCGHIQIEHEELCDARGVCGGCVLNWLKQPCGTDY